jgi:hypothetical protein
MVFYTIGIIGSRGDVYQENLYYTKELYDKLVCYTRNLIKTLGYTRNSEIQLISGGCSFIDHIIITLYNEAKLTSDPYHSLIIYSPCRWNSIDMKFHSSSSDHHNYNNYIGEFLNKLHRNFSERLMRNTLVEINDIQKNNNVFFDSSSNSFQCRNYKIASSCKDVLIAFGWKESINEIFNSGTKITWNLCNQCRVKKYISINTIQDKDKDIFIVN